MSGRDRVQKTRIRLPSVSLPKLTKTPKNPRGWGLTNITIRSQGLPGAARFQQQEPAGDPPGEWPGTRPEWAIYWALTKLGLDPDNDFTYQANLPGVGTSYYSTVDFLLHDYDIGIEVQGTFWHLGVGSERQYHDRMRALLFAEQGLKVIFIDEKDCLADPIYYVREAMNGNDHSEIGRQY